MKQQSAISNITAIMLLLYIDSCLMWRIYSASLIITVQRVIGNHLSILTQMYKGKATAFTHLAYRIKYTTERHQAVSQVF